MACSSTQGKRPTMEDAHVILDSFCGIRDALFVGVFDGHFGTGCSSFLAQRMGPSLSQVLLDQPHALPALTKVYHDLDNEWLSTHDDESGSTSATVFILHDRLYVANAGDSRCVISRNGLAERVSFDHKPDDFDERRRYEALLPSALIVRILTKGGTVVGGRLQGKLGVSRGFGDRSFKDYVICDPRTLMSFQYRIPHLRFGEARDFASSTVCCCRV